MNNIWRNQKKQWTALSFCSMALLSSCNQPKQDKPNIIFVFADDMGYADAGCYGQKLIETPNIDKLASQGKLFTNAYSASPVSAPSRCGLLTGLHMGHAYIRGNDPWTERGDVWNYHKASNDPSLEGQRPIPAHSVTIPKLLKTQGYVTGCFGKWGLGAPFTEGVPEKQGFDLFYGYNCQRQAHTYFPNHLWRNDERVSLRNEVIPPTTGLPEGADKYDEKSYEFLWQHDYSAELIHNESLRFIEDNATTPFFMFYATTLPHTPLQAPKRLVDKYVEKLGDEEPSTGGSYYPCRYPNATYAAMITYLDEQIGEIIDKLKELGIYENTLIIFSSDNGPSGDPTYFQSAKPFQSVGNRVKGSLYEGGIRTPFIAVWENRIEAGSVSDLPIVLYDLLPTFCEIGGMEIPSHTDGISFLPELLGEKDQKRHEYLYWEHAQGGGQQAVRFGHWKGLRVDINSKGNTKIKLFNLQDDVQEINDLSYYYPEIIDKMEQYMSEARSKPEVEYFYLKPFDN
ncbi:arylsulfatase [Porphyromonadaceae bacterium KH3R12]|nr:arylsulfatase [Porphyromonadaceae bacterium KH3R12]